MTKLEKTLYDLLLPLVDAKDDLTIVESEGNNKRTVFLNVETADSDIARLIGRRGNMANSIRQTMLIAARLENKRVMINFDSKKGA